MNEYTASNGYTVSRLSDGQTKITREKAGAFEFVTWCGNDEYTAIAEHALAKRDEELVRWRWPENPDYVVYPESAPRYLDGTRPVVVVNERTGASVKFSRGILQHLHRAPFGDTTDAAISYYSAHPEPKPAWHDAKVHEVWTIQHGMDEAYYPFRVVHEGKAKFVYVDGESWFYTDDPQIGDGQRIYPPEDAS